ncbi:MAG: hypothetical protein OCD02_18785 [Spirochaetaceae bacterium]
MKKILLLIMFYLVSILYAETNFSGTSEIKAMGLIPIDDYDSLINPDNQVMNINDLCLLPSIQFKIESYDEYSNFESLFKVSNYPIGSLLYNMDPSLVSFVSETGEFITTFNILRLFIDYTPVDNLTLSVGRKSYFMGFGYGWNPVDNLNPQKNPENPDSELLGIDSISATWSYENLLNLRVVTALNQQLFEMGADYDDLGFGLDLSLILEGIEFLGTGYINLDEDNDLKENSVGIAVKKDLFGIGLYGEGIYLDYSDYKINYLIGMEYLFETDTFVTVEYFYNDEGLNKEARLEYKTLLESDPTPLYTSGYYTKQYLLLNISQSLYDYNSTLGLAAIYSIDSTNLMLSPSIDIDVSENMNLNLSYSGLMDFNEDDFTETDISPVKHIFSINFKYSF